jgi:hypothetical protein
MSDFPSLFPGAPQTVTCIECGGLFEKNSKAHRLICSDACKRSRAVRYAAEYRQTKREMRGKILATFGGRAPTQAELLEIIKSRKAKP